MPPGKKMECECHGILSLAGLDVVERLRGCWDCRGHVHCAAEKPDAAVKPWRWARGIYGRMEVAHTATLR